MSRAATCVRATSRLVEDGENIGGSPGEDKRVFARADPRHGRTEGIPPRDG